VAAQIKLRDLEEIRTLMAPYRTERNFERPDVVPSPARKRILGVFRTHERVWWLQMASYFSVKRNKEIQANVVVSECTGTVCCRVVPYYYVIIFHIWFGEGVFQRPKYTAYFAALTTYHTRPLHSVSAVSSCCK